MANAEQIDKKLLAGLVFKSSRAKKTDEGTTNIPTERTLTPADVLDWKDTGANVIIVTADGQKYTVNKKSAEKGKE